MHPHTHALSNSFDAYLRAQYPQDYECLSEVLTSMFGLHVGKLPNDKYRFFTRNLVSCRSIF